jgi:tetratricopeptide (TPR) repeat protein
VALILAGGLGWVVGDWQARRTEAEGRVAEALAEAEPRLREGDPHDPALISAARKAEAQLAGGLLRDGVRRQVEQLLADLKMLEALEEIRLARAEVKEGRYDNAGADRAFARAFREYGIDVAALDVHEAAAHIRPRAISLHLALALDTWAWARVRAASTTVPTGLPSQIDWMADRLAAGGNDWKRLLAVARAADPDPWRCALREALAGGGKGDVEKLVTSAPVPALPPATLALLGHLFDEKERGDAATAVAAALRDGQQRYPADFWINANLAAILVSQEPPQLDEAIGFLRAAVAVRPRAVGVRLNLGLALVRRGKVDEALAALREAVKLRPEDGYTRAALGFVYGAKGDWDGAIVANREALRLNPNLDAARISLANALQAKCDWEGMIVANREALRLNPNLDMSRVKLGVALRERGHGLWEKGDRAGAHAAYREAREHLEEALRREPDKDYTVHNMAFFLATCLDERLRDPGRAVELSKRYVERWPGNSGSWHMLGITLYRAGHPLDAIPALERAVHLKAVQRGAHFAWEYFHLALAYRQLGDLYRSTLYYAAGVRWVEQHAPANTEFRRMRAYTAAQLGITDAAQAGTRPQAETESKAQDSRPSNP